MSMQCDEKTRLLDNFLLDISACCDKESLKESVRRLLHPFGYQHWMFSVQLTQAERQTQNTVWCMGDMPMAWLIEYAAKNYVFYDPVVHHSSVCALPFRWDVTRGWEDAPVSAQNVMKAFAKHWQGGLCIPLHTPRQHFGFFKICYEHAGSEESCCALKYLSYTGPVFVHKLFEAVERLGLIASPALTLPDLTAVEQDCARLSAQGKCVREIARELGLKERTARHYLDNFKTKMQTNSLRDAVTKATRLGLTAPRYGRVAQKAFRQWASNE
ncbi:helix-turn-helix transcriptional regulator [Geoalkalibacter halelectricus]|uniref:helix-turn-helix transcriptional regulator n=1 Tax=Geoalkalibacter halelectricus TaxID=2847045 RepID=UPI003D1A022A